MKYTPKKIVLTIILTIIAIIVNFLGSEIAGLIVFPLYLDSILTIGVVSLCGVIPGIVCAFCTNLILTIKTGSTILFSLCHITTAILSWVVLSYEKKMLQKNNKNFPAYSLDIFLWAGFWTAISNAILGNIIADFVYASNPVRVSANIVIQGIFAAYPNLAFANNVAGFIENLADKMISSILSFLFYKAFQKAY